MYLKSLYEKRENECKLLNLNLSINIRGSQTDRFWDSLCPKSALKFHTYITNCSSYFMLWSEFVIWRNLTLRTNEVLQRFMCLPWTVDTSVVIVVQFILFFKWQLQEVYLFMTCVFTIDHIIYFISYVLYINFHFNS